MGPTKIFTVTARADGSMSIQDAMDYVIVARAQLCLRNNGGMNAWSLTAIQKVAKRAYDTTLRMQYTPDVLDTRRLARDIIELCNSRRRK